MKRRLSRVAIRAPEAEDRAEFLELVRASRKLHHPWVHPPATAADYNKYLQKVTGDRHAGFFICRRESGEIIGVANLNEIVRGPLQSAYLGFYVGQPHAGTGLMTEGLELVIRHAFVRMNLHRLEANIQPGNKKSIALVSRCGFVKEGFSPRYLKIGGRWRDHERWALIADAWKVRPRLARVSGWKN